jgi:hypothetical protein
MGTVSEMSGLVKAASALTAGDVYKAATARAATDLMQKVAIVKLAEDPEVAEALAEAMGGVEDMPEEDVALEDEGDPELTDALLEAYAAPDEVDDEDREALLSTAEALEDEEKAAGLAMPTTRDYVYAILKSAGVIE